MPNIIKTIYAKGVFRPIKQVNFPENTKVEISALTDYPFYTSPRDLLEQFKYTQEVYQKSMIKLSSGLEFQRKIRQESDDKINLRFKELHV